MNIETDDEQLLSATQAWLEHVVIGLNLCPFAKAVHVQRRIHYAVCRASIGSELLEALEYEMTSLAKADIGTRETTLLIVPLLWPRFLDMFFFLDDADRLLRRLGLEGILQIASFHPAYQFAGTAEDDIGNFTNRSPFPMLHLLREDSVDRAVKAIPNPENIYQANIQTLQALGHDGWAALSARPIRGR